MGETAQTDISLLGDTIVTALTGGVRDSLIWLDQKCAKKEA